MHITFRCPNCDSSQTSGECAPGGLLSCASCDWKRPIADGDITNGRPAMCLLCGNGDLWRQKNFPIGWGVVIVALGAILSSIAWANYQPLWALGILMLFGLADMLLFMFLPDVLTCYRCGTRHHGCGEIGEHPAFDHEIGERYRQERLRELNK
jgi:hypothetical protein